MDIEGVGGDTVPGEEDRNEQPLQEISKAEQRAITKVAKSSWVWNYVYQLTNGPIEKSGHVCKICYDNIDVDNAPMRVFQKCLISLYNESTSNGESHLKTHHRNVIPKAQGKKPMVVKNSVDISQSESGMTTMSLFLARGNDAVNNQVHAAIAMLVVNRRLPLSFATDPELTAIIELASHLKPGSYKAMTRGKMDAALASMFSSFVTEIKARLACTRSVYSSADNSNVPPGWLIVCHDGWDSTIKQFFGVSVYWIDPVKWKRYKVALGLAIPDGHSADACAAAARSILSRYDIQDTDLYMSINDTTNASVATGRRLTGEDGDCHMHMANLVADHACGKRTRSENHVIIDSFPQCESLRVKARKLAKYVFSKKAKSRQVQYKSRNDNANMKTIRIGLDNDTRISGTEMMFQQVLRSFYTLHVYMNQESATGRAHMLTEQEWELLAGFEAVLRPVCNFSFVTQVDTQPTAGSSWLQVLTYVCIFILPIRKFVVNFF